MHRNTCGSLEEQVMLLQHKSTVECFHSFLEFSQTLTSVSINNYALVTGNPRLFKVAGSEGELR